MKQISVTTSSVVLLASSWLFVCINPLQASVVTRLATLVHFPLSAVYQEPSVCSGVLKMLIFGLLNMSLAKVWMTELLNRQIYLGVAG
ncbi:TPA: hypothetical protein ACSP88_001277 [Aeromonas hydrophila]